MDREALRGYTALRGLSAELLFTDDPGECQGVLQRSRVYDPAACVNGLVSLVFYRPALLELLGLHSVCTKGGPGCPDPGGALFFRVRTSGRIYNAVLGRKSYIVLPFVTPYLALATQYPGGVLSGRPTAVLGVFHAVVDRADPARPRAGGTIALEACGRPGAAGRPSCVRLAEVKLDYRGDARLAEGATGVLRHVRRLLEEGREAEARRLAERFLGALGLRVGHRTARELVAALDRLHQPHRVARFGWQVATGQGLPQELERDLRRALEALLTAASAAAAGERYLLGFSAGKILQELKNEYLGVSPAQPPAGGQCREVSSDGNLIKLGPLEIARILPAHRPKKRAHPAPQAQRGHLPQAGQATLCTGGSGEHYVSGGIEIEYINNTYTHEAYYRIYLGGFPNNSWRLEFYRPHS